MIRRGVFLFLIALAISACSKSDKPQPPAAPQTVGPQDLVVPSSATTPSVTPGTGTVVSSRTVPSGVAGLIVFSNGELLQGGALLFPSSDNQTLSFNDQSNPVSGQSLRYFWNGKDVAGQHIFAGVDLIHTARPEDYESTPGRNLQSGKYTHVTFDARGTLTANTVLTIVVADDGNPSTPAPCLVLSTLGNQDDSSPGRLATCHNFAPLAESWQSYSIPVPASSLISVKDFFKATFVYKTASSTSSPGDGGIIFFDQVEYQ